MQDEGETMGIKQKPGAAGAALLSVSDFADRMGIALPTARKLCYSRKVATVRFNRSVLVPATEVERLIQAHLQPALPGREQTR